MDIWSSQAGSHIHLVQEWESNKDKAVITPTDDDYWLKAQEAMYE